MLLQECAYPYEYMDDWEKFNETSFLKKKIFTVTQMRRILMMQIMHMQKEFVKILKYKIWENIVICMFKLIHC